ncbi:MAG TPA: benzoate/H(+) symporter BenE family transporter [Nocardioides sp.]|nr:benzoate/H(+) symporter BenE family transporter [Nocardioides sp.]
MQHRATTTIAGITLALVGFTSSFAVVLAGLRAVGASPAEAASGLVALCLTLGLGTILLSRRHRIPVTLAWSTPGAALLATTGVVGGGWPAAVGAFLVVAVLVLATALWPALGGLIGRIPPSLAQAMLAGVLFPLCLAPVTGIAASPLLVGPAVVTWLAGLVVARRWAVPLAFVVALGTVVVEVVRHGDRLTGVLPEPTWTTPQLSIGAVLGLALPLYLVTMAAQNLPGVAVLASYDFEVPWRASMAVTGVGTAIAAPFGGHAINLAAITAALAAGPDAGPDRDRRWRAADTAGWTYLVLALASPLLVALVTAAPAGILEAVAGLALLGTLGAAVRTALAGDGPHEPALITLLVAASGTTILGVGAAFWSLVAGLAVHGLLSYSGTRR